MQLSQGTREEASGSTYPERCEIDCASSATPLTPVNSLRGMFPSPQITRGLYLANSASRFGLQCRAAEYSQGLLENQSCRGRHLRMLLIANAPRFWLIRLNARSRTPPAGANGLNGSCARCSCCPEASPTMKTPLLQVPSTSEKSLP